MSAILNSRAPEWAEKLSERDRELIDSLSRERDPEIQGQGCLVLAAGWESEGRADLAAGAYLAILEDPEKNTLHDKARQRFEALRGEGQAHLRAELLIKGFAQTATDYRMIAPMGAASILGTIAHAGSLARLAGTSRATWLTRGIGARFAAGGSATLAEIPVFVAMHRTLNPSLEDSFSDDLKRSGILLGALRLSGMGSPVRAWHRPLLTFPALFTAQKVEERLGLRPKADLTTTFTDSLASLLSLSVGSHLGQRFLGPGWPRLHAELALRTRKPSSEIFKVKNETPETGAVPKSDLALFDKLPIAGGPLMIYGTLWGFWKRWFDRTPGKRSDPIGREDQRIFRRIDREVQGALANRKDAKLLTLNFEAMTGRLLKVRDPEVGTVSVNFQYRPERKSWSLTDDSFQGLVKSFQFFKDPDRRAVIHGLMRWGILDQVQVALEAIRTGRESGEDSAISASAWPKSYPKDALPRFTDPERRRTYHWNADPGRPSQVPTEMFISPFYDVYANMEGLKNGQGLLFKVDPAENRPLQELLEVYIHFDRSLALMPANTPEGVKPKVSIYVTLGSELHPFRRGNLVDLHFVDKKEAPAPPEGVPEPDPNPADSEPEFFTTWGFHGEGIQYLLPADPQMYLRPENLWKVMAVRDREIVLAPYRTVVPGEAAPMLTLGFSGKGPPFPEGTVVEKIPQIYGGVDLVKNPAAEIAEKAGGVFARERKEGGGFWLADFNEANLTVLPGKWSQHIIRNIRILVNNASGQPTFVRVQTQGASPFGHPGTKLFEFVISLKEAAELGLIEKEKRVLYTTGIGKKMVIIPEFLPAGPSSVEAKEEAPRLAPNEPLFGISEFGEFFNIFRHYPGFPIRYTFPARVDRIFPQHSLMDLTFTDSKQILHFGTGMTLSYLGDNPFRAGERVVAVRSVMGAAGKEVGPETAFPPEGISLEDSDGRTFRIRPLDIRKAWVPESGERVFILSAEILSPEGQDAYRKSEERIRLTVGVLENWGDFRKIMEGNFSLNSRTLFTSPQEAGPLGLDFGTGRSFQADLRKLRDIFILSSSRKNAAEPIRGVRELLSPTTPFLKKLDDENLYLDLGKEPFDLILGRGDGALGRNLFSFNPRISRQHVRIRRNSLGQVFLENLSKISSVFVNSRQMGNFKLENGEVTQLTRDDVFQIGGQTIHLGWEG